MRVPITIWRLYFAQPYIFCIVAIRHCGDGSVVARCLLGGHTSSCDGSSAARSPSHAGTADPHVCRACRPRGLSSAKCHLFNNIDYGTARSRSPNVDRLGTARSRFTTVERLGAARSHGAAFVEHVLGRLDPTAVNYQPNNTHRPRKSSDAGVGCTVRRDPGPDRDGSCVIQGTCGSCPPKSFSCRDGYCVTPGTCGSCPLGSSTRRDE